jgi:anti-sigma factor RsiW
MNKSTTPHDPLRDPECQRHARLLGAYVDGELDAAKLLEIEGHVSRCEMCRERVELDRAVRGTLKKVVRRAAAESAGTDDARVAMRARMMAAMSAEVARGESRDGERDEGARLAPATSKGAGRLLGWRTVVPLSTAAALAIVWGSLPHNPIAPGGGSVKAAGLANDPLAGFVEMHSRPWPMERTDPQGVRALEQYVGVPVRPSTFEKTGAHSMGGRLMPIKDERAALLEYRIGQGPAAERVSVFIYDPRKIQVNGAELQARAVGTAQVRVGRANGYSVAVTQRDGIGYALVSTLDQDRSAELAALADQD